LIIRNGLRCTSYLSVIVVGLIFGSYSVVAYADSEEIIYNTQNTINKTINAIEITRIDTGEQLFYRSVDVSPVNRNTWNLSFGWSIGAFSPDSGDPVPEEVEIRWRNLPKEGQAFYRGDIEGPFVVKIRSKIPQRILKKSREPGFDLALMFLVGKSPITFCWRLGDYASSPPSNIKVEIGGDCVEDRYLKSNEKSSLHSTLFSKPVILPINENWSISNRVNREIKNLEVAIANSKNSRYSHRIPEELDVSWEKLQKQENSNHVQFVGPFRIKIRSLISPEALTLAKDSYHHIVILVDTHFNPPTICWELWDITENPKGELKMGSGDC